MTKKYNQLLLNKKNNMRILGVTINEVLRDYHGQFDKIYRKAFIKNDSLVGMNDNFEAYEEEVDWDAINKIEKEKINLPIDTENLMNNYKFDTQFNFDKFVNEDYNFQILGTANSFPKAFDHLMRVQGFGEANKMFDTFLVSKENGKSVTSTMHFLSKSASRIRNIKFIDDNKDVWNFCDVVVTDLPEILDSKPEGKISIKINKLYNQWSKSDYTFDDLKELSEKDFLINLFPLALQ